MAIPDPEPGLVIKFEYMWRRENAGGAEHGRKARPCAVVVALEPDDDGGKKVVVCPITHSKPTPAAEGIEVPPKLARQLGLDWERCWIIVTEVNRFTWPGYGLVPVEPGRWTYGFLSPKLFGRIKEALLERLEVRRLSIVEQ